MSNTRKVIRSRIKLLEVLYRLFLLYIEVILIYIAVGIILSHNEILTKIVWIIPFAIVLLVILVIISEFKFIIINTRINRIRVFSLFIWGRRYNIKAYKGIIISSENGGSGDYKIAYLVDKSMCTRLKINGSIYNNSEELINSINLPKMGYPELSISNYIKLLFTGCIKVEKINKNSNKKKIVISRIRLLVFMLYPFLILFGIASSYVIVKTIQSSNEIFAEMWFIILFVFLLFIVLISIRELKFIIVTPHINQIRVFSLFIWGKRYDIKDYKGIIITEESSRAGDYKVAYLVDNTMHTSIKLNANISNIDEMVEAIDLPKIGYLAFSAEYLVRRIFTNRIKIKDESIIKSFKIWKSNKIRRIMKAKKRRSKIKKAKE